MTTTIQRFIGILLGYSKKNSNFARLKTEAIVTC